MQKQMVDKLSILLRETPNKVDKNFCLKVAMCFKEINKVIPDIRWSILWQMYLTQVYGESDVYKQAGAINQIDRKIYEITGIKTPLIEGLEKLAEVVGAKRF